MNEHQQRKKPGRPPVNGERTVKHEVSMTQEAWTWCMWWDATSYSAYIRQLVARDMAQHGKQAMAA